MKKHGRDVIAIIVLVLLILAFFWPLLSGRYWIPQGGGDLVSFLWPTWRFAAGSLRGGTIPLWNPTLYSGAPFAADNQTALFYPVNLLLAALGGEPGYGTMEGLVVFHMALAAVLMYLLLRDKRLNRFASAFGGLAFALSDPFITHIGNLNLNATVAYLPALVLLAERAFTRRSAAKAVLAGAVLAIASFAGHGQMLLLLALALAFLTLYRVVLSARQGWRAVAEVAGLGVLIVFVGIAAAAVAIYPSYEFMQDTLRTALSWQEATRFSLPWRALIGMAVPGFYGRGPADFWGSWDRVEVGYMGILTLALAAAGLLARRRKDSTSPATRGFPVSLFATFGVLGFALALGARTPLYRLLYALPGFGSVRAPARLVFLGCFGLAALAAYGLDRIQTSRRAQITTVATLVILGAIAMLSPRILSVPPERLTSVQHAVEMALALCIIGLVWALGTARWQGTQWLSAVAVAILALDLILTGSIVEIDPNDPTAGFRHDDVVSFLRSDTSLFRIDSSASSTWQPDAAAIYGLYDMNGIANPLNLAIYESYRWSIAARGDALYNLLGVKYVLSDKGNPPGDERLVPVYTDGPAVDVYLNTRAYPMAQLIYSAHEAKTTEEAWEAIHTPGFDPTQTVVLQGSPQPLEGVPDASPSLIFTAYTGNSLSVRVSTPAPAYLLLSEVYYPDWHADVDGQRADVLQADYLFRAVYVPEGDHEVRLWFSPRSFWIGLGISAATWLTLAVWAIAGVHRRRRSRATHLGGA